MANIEKIGAVIFDMDGTLIDSELLTAPTIEAFCRDRGITNSEIHDPSLYGKSWESIARQLVDTYPRLAGIDDIPDRLHEIFHRLGREQPPAPIRCARETVIAAHALMPTAIVSSSYRENIEQTMHQLGIREYVSFYAGADDYANPKPAPDGFLKAASEMGVPARNCLVFEDSITGIEAAKAAGMFVVAITHRCNDLQKAMELADLGIVDYSELEQDFFSRIRGSEAH